MGFSPITGPLAVPANDGLRAARGLGVVENPSDPLDPNRDWRRGWRYRRTACATGAGYRRDPCDYLPLDWEDEAPRAGTRQGMPFLVGAARDCSTFGSLATVADLATEARNLLNLVQYAQVGAELWGGAQAKASVAAGSPGFEHNMYLTRDQLPGPVANPDFVRLTAGAAVFEPGEGLAEMEQALKACTPGLRLIHAPARVVSWWAEGGGLEFTGGRIQTKLGTIVISEAGYDGSGPDSDGNPAGTSAASWVYGTGPVQVRIDTEPAMFPEPGDLVAAISRRTNDVAFRAEKLAMVTWDCCHYGARVGLP